MSLPSRSGRTEYRTGTLLKAERPSSDEHSPFDQLPHDHAPRRDGWHRMMHFYEDVELCCAQLTEHVPSIHSHGPTTGDVIRARGMKREHAPCHRGHRGAPTGPLHELPERENVLPHGLPARSRRAAIVTDRMDRGKARGRPWRGYGAGKVVHFTIVKNRVPLPMCNKSRSVCRMFFILCKF